MQEKRLFDFAQFRFDAEKQRLLHKNEIIALPPKAAELLLLLIDNQGRVLEKDFLMETLWRETFVEESNLTQNIYLLRKALGKTSDGEAMIKTLPKRGYQFVPEVRAVTAEADALVVSKYTSIRARIVEEEFEDEQIATKQETLPIEFAAPAPLVLPETARKRGRISRIQIFAVCGLILLFGAGIYFGLRSESAANAAKAPIKSIAVMPLKTIGGDDERFLGLGMADAIITRLGKTGKISVSPTDAVRRYDEKGANAVDAGRALDAEAVLTGSIQRDGEQTRVTVQLIRVADNQTLWSDSFDEQNKNIFALQDSISQRLAGALTLKLSGGEQENLRKKRTVSVEAAELYQKGRYYFARRTPEQVRKAIQMFEQAARLDANYAEAHAGIAAAYAVTGSGLPPSERFPKAKAAALRALQLDENSADAHTSLAFILYKSEWNWLEAETHFRRAVQLDPNYSMAHHWFGEMLGLTGRFDEGISELREAVRLDPLSVAAQSDLGRILYRARRYDEAVAQAKKTLELDQNTPNGYTTIAYAVEQQGDYAAAVEANLNYLRLSNFNAPELTELKKTFDDAGWQSYWRKQLEINGQRPDFQRLSAYAAAEIHLRAGDREEALKMLEKSYQERGDAPLLIKVEPVLDPLRADSRFAFLTQRSGIGKLDAEH